MKRSSLHTRSFRRIYFSVLATDELKMALRARKVSGDFKKRAPSFLAIKVLAPVVQRVDNAIQRIGIGKTKYAIRWIVAIHPLNNWGLYFSLGNCIYILSPVVIENNEILYRDYVDISVAVATPKVCAASGPGC